MEERKEEEAENVIRKKTGQTDNYPLTGRVEIQGKDGWMDG